MRVLVTGSSGYIGSVLTPALADAGHEVVGVDSEIFRGSGYFEFEPAIETWALDIRDITLVDLDGFEAVLHLAGFSNDPLGEFQPDLTMAINHEASIRLATLAKAAGIRRFVFASSCSNYGAAGNDFLDEESTFCPVTAYAKSKVETEHDLSDLADDDFSPTFLRASTAYGVSPFLRFDLVLNNLMAWAYTTGRVYLKSDGTPWRPVVHIRDIALAYLAVLDAPLEIVHNRAYNVGSSAENYRISELAAIVSETVPGSVIEYASGAAPDSKCYRVDCNRIAREIPGFKPQWTARHGARELYQAFEDTGLSIDDVEGARYNRLAHARWLIDRGELSAKFRWLDESLKAVT